MMRRQIKEIYATCSENQGEFFDVDNTIGYCIQDDCIRWKKIEIYGSKRELLDTEYGTITNGDHSKLEKIGDIVGYLILGKQIYADGELIYDICDDVDGDLEYVASTLMDSGEPLDDDPAQDIFYIHEFSMSENFPDLPLKARILDELPHICLRLFHVKPDILAFFPTPMPYDDTDEDDKARREAVMELSAQKINSVFSDILDGEKASPKKVIELGAVREFSDDEMNMIMGRRRPGRSYPESAKDSGEFKFYETNGFIEAGDSRLLYKQIWE